MKLKTQFIIGAAFAMFLILSIGTFLCLFFHQRVTNEIDRDRIAKEIFRGVFELNIITHDFTSYPGKRAQQQWETKQGSLLNLILLAKKEFKKKEEVLIVERIRQNQAGIRELFYQLFSILKHQPIGEERFRSKALQDAVTNQIFILSQEIVADSFQLVDLTHARIVQTKKIAIWLVFIFIITVVGIFIAAFYWMRRKILKPIFSLHKGTEIVAGGDLEYKIDVKNHNEIGALASAFNTMTSDLHKSQKELKNYATTLELKVKARTKELQEANIKLQELDHLKSMFIASMSHELRTPLNSIIGFTGIILQGISGEITEDQRKELTMVKNSAHHLLSLINDVIDVSKIEGDKVKLLIEEFNVADLMQEVNDSFKVAVDKKGLKLSLEIPKKLAITSDKRRTKQVIINLVSNAVKFTDREEIAIKAAKKGGRVEVTVADTGIGIKKEDMDKLFKQFSQIYVEGRPTVEGTGLGLYLSKKIANILGGQIKAESEFGKGSVFTFTLPLKYMEYMEGKNEKDSGSRGQ